MWINAKGFQKIMKKYDKRNQLRGTGLELLPEFEKRLEKEVRRRCRSCDDALSALIGRCSRGGVRGGVRVRECV